MGSRRFCGAGLVPNLSSVAGPLWATLPFVAALLPRCARGETKQQLLMALNVRLKTDERAARGLTRRDAWYWVGGLLEVGPLL